MVTIIKKVVYDFPLDKI